MADFDRLRSLGASELTHGEVCLAPLDEAHREPLRAACASDPALWTDLYSYSMLGDAFDRWWRCENGRTPAWISFAVLHREQVVGVTNYLNIVPADDTLEIGGTYLGPAARGTGVNRAMKLMMLDNAFAAGARRVEFRVDAINTRSRAAVTKLGANLDGILRQHRRIWTGRLRDTCVFSILADEWPALRPRLAGA